MKDTDARQRGRGTTTEAMKTKVWRLPGFWSQTLSLTLNQRVEHEVVKLQPYAVRRPTFTVHAIPHSWISDCPVPATNAEGEILHNKLRQECRVNDKSVGGGTDLVVMPPTSSNQRTQKQGGQPFCRNCSRPTPPLK